MAKDCQYCGTSVFIPEQGALVLNPKHINQAGKEPSLPLNHESPEAKVYIYRSKEELRLALVDWFEASTPDYWIHILNTESSQSFPISIRHLYERLQYPELADLIHSGLFQSHLQPIVDMKHNRVHGYESLLRTKDLSVPPGELFSYASRSGLQSMLDQKARRTAVRAKSEHLNAGDKIFINFLPSTIYVPEFCLKHTFQIVKEFNIDPEDLVFEVVETEKIDDVEHLKSILETYKASGMKVALDDVGSGYSTLEMLSLLQPDYLKIDRSYIQNCHSDVNNQAFLFDVMERAKHLNIHVLAEGIELQEEWEWLQQLGVDFGQGYYIGKPQAVPEKELILP
ncbi:EAL domain-containing protein [Halobacillus litoralis]|uniref:EAL domain-containing protein n=1 Tax=Halobacillus litoralis TaxID=45668 RepID=A0A845E6A2_9BACI|nr:EAL domain-containing protein [Halobacillus litoralis]MYL50412.1 EAL domain-containing protein [Halobacillus litoralis]